MWVNEDASSLSIPGSASMGTSGASDEDRVMHVDAALPTCKRKERARKRKSEDQKTKVKRLLEAVISLI